MDRRCRSEQYLPTVLALPLRKQDFGTSHWQLADKLPYQDRTPIVMLPEGGGAKSATRRLSLWRLA
jgi:hypothetical protein